MSKQGQCEFHASGRRDNAEGRLESMGVTSSTASKFYQSLRMYIHDASLLADAGVVAGPALTGEKKGKHIHLTAGK